MGYFNNIGKIEYEGQILDDYIFKYVFPPEYYKAGSFQPYFVQNGESARQIAQRRLGDDKLYWMVYTYNNIIDPYQEWPIDNIQLEDYSEKQSALRYGVDYSISQFNEVYDELFLENEAKRPIQLPLKSGLPYLLDQIDIFFREHPKSEVS